MVLGVGIMIAGGGCTTKQLGGDIGTPKVTQAITNPSCIQVIGHYRYDKALEGRCLRTSRRTPTASALHCSTSFCYYLLVRVLLLLPHRHGS